MTLVLNFRNYRKHLRDKRFIENRKPLSSEAVEWAKRYKIEMIKKRLEKEKSILEERLMLVLGLVLIEETIILLFLNFFIF